MNNVFCLFEEINKIVYVWCENGIFCWNGLILKVIKNIGWYKVFLFSKKCGWIKCCYYGWRFVYVYNKNIKILVLFI